MAFASPIGLLHPLELEQPKNELGRNIIFADQENNLTLISSNLGNMSAKEVEDPLEELRVSKEISPHRELKDTWTEIDEGEELSNIHP